MAAQLNQNKGGDKIAENVIEIADKLVNYCYTGVVPPKATIQGV